MNSDFLSARDAPLRSLRVLLSPSDQEAADLRERLGGAARATRENVKAALNAWAADCHLIPRSTAVLYVAGHGVFHDRTGSNLLLEDLDEPGVNNVMNLDASLDLAAVIVGLGHIGLEASYAFVDACQPVLKSGRKYGGGGLSFGYEETAEDRLGSYVYSAAARGTYALGEPGKGSVFGEAILDALTRGPIEKDSDNELWVVTSRGIAARIAAVPAQHPTLCLHTFPSVAGRELPFHRLKITPRGSLIVGMAPPQRAAEFELSVENWVGLPDVPRSPFAPNPFVVEVEPGIHTVTPHTEAGVRFTPSKRSLEIGPFEEKRVEFNAP
jgi:hypothetical protein